MDHFKLWVWLVILAVLFLIWGAVFYLMDKAVDSFSPVW